MKHLYLSKATQEEIKLLSLPLIEEHYTCAISFIKEYLDKWKNMLSVDGKIKLVTQIQESPCKLITIEYKTNLVQISVNGLPVIKENRWDNLIQNVTESFLIFPNSIFKINNEIINMLLAKLPTIDKGIIYKAILEIYAPQQIEESCFKLLQPSGNIPAQEEIENLPNVLLTDEFNYKEIPLPPKPQVLQPQTIVQPYVYIVRQSLDILDSDDKEILNTLK